MKKTSYLIYVVASVLLIVFFSNCKKTDNASPVNTTKATKGINGFVQKGPFITGSSITAYDLNADLSPTGKSYNTQTTDNKGAFSFDNITLSSNFATFQANGFYYNEVSGTLSAAPINLYAISQVSDSTNVNINLLTDLEKARVETLVKSGKSFSDAKQQAQKEILAIFGIVKPDIKPSENLNIAESGDDNAILLAISSILQSNLSEAMLTQLLSEISNDIKADGILSDSLYYTLLNNAAYLDTATIKTNLINEYGGLGETFTDLNFGKYIDSFIIKNSLRLTGSGIYYPEVYTWPSWTTLGISLLPINDTLITPLYNNDVSLVAYVPNGGQLTVKISELDMQDSTETPYFSYGDRTGNYLINPNYASGIYSATIQLSINNQSYYYGQSIGIPGDYTYAVLEVVPGHSLLIEYYENGSTIPTRTKTVHII